MSDVTLILESIDQGDPEAAAQLLPLVYEELRKVAAQQLVREKPGQTLDPTALVHEAYLRLLGPDGAAHFHNRQHFFGAAAQAMRRILIENARRKGRAKRGGDSSPRELLILNEVLERFARHDSVKAKLVELRFFGGLTLEQAAECLEISLSTAERSWRYARAWLYTAMSSGEFEKI
jgi:RNA polymerase sigma factor (TIGR02999 family)